MRKFLTIISGASVLAIIRKDLSSIKGFVIFWNVMITGTELMSEICLSCTEMLPATLDALFCTKQRPFSESYAKAEKGHLCRHIPQPMHLSLLIFTLSPTIEIAAVGQTRYEVLCGKELKKCECISFLEYEIQYFSLQLQQQPLNSASSKVKPEKLSLYTRFWGTIGKIYRLLASDLFIESFFTVEFSKEIKKIFFINSSVIYFIFVNQIK